MIPSGFITQLQVLHYKNSVCPVLTFLHSLILGVYMGKNRHSGKIKDDTATHPT